MAPGPMGQGPRLYGVPMGHGPGPYGVPMVLVPGPMGPYGPGPRPYRALWAPIGDGPRIAWAQMGPYEPYIHICFLIDPQ